MIIPIGHEQTEVRRLPWITIGVMVLCLAAFIATDVPSASDAWMDEVALEEAADYWMEHPYLEPDGEILDYVAFHLEENERDQFIEDIRAVNPPPANVNQIYRQQDELRQLSDVALGLSSGPVGENDYTRWGLTPTQPRALNLFSHIFMHGGWIHLIGNLFLFFLAAPAIEDRWGRPLFASFFLLAGAFAGVFYSVLTPTSSLPLVGASGAIAGVLGAFLVRFWDTKIRFMYLFFLGVRWLKGTFEAPAWLMLPLWFGNELFQAWLFGSLGVSSGVAYLAHVGGFLFGVAVALGMARFKIEDRFIHAAIESKVTLMESNPVLEQALEAREQGDLGEAFALLKEEVGKSPEDTDLALAFWDVAVASNRSEAAAPAMVAAIRRTASRGGDLELAATYWSDMTDVLPGALADPTSLVRMIPVLIAREQLNKAVLALRQGGDPNNRGITPGLALRLIDQAREIDPPSVLQAAQRALSFSDIDEGKRRRLEQTVQELTASGVELPEPASNTIPTESEEADAQQSWESGESIPLADEDGPEGSAGSVAAEAPQAAAANAAPRALSADGDLSESAMDSGSLSSDPLEEFGFDPEAQLDSLPEAEFGLEPDAVLGLDPDALQDEPVDLGDGAAKADAMAFGMLNDSAIGLDAEQELETAAAALLGSSAPPPLPSTPPPLAPAAPASTPPPLPSDEPADVSPQTADIAAPEHSLGDSIPDDDLLALIESPRFHSVKVAEAVPIEFSDRGLVIRLPGDRKGRIEYDKVQGIAVAAISKLAKGPVLVIDILLNWHDDSDGILRLVRLRSDQFIPSRIVEGASDETEAIRLLLSRLIDATEATLLPDENAAHARPMHSQDDLDSYQRQVLQISG